MDVVRTVEYDVIHYNNSTYRRAERGNGTKWYKWDNGMWRELENKPSRELETVYIRNGLHKTEEEK